MVIRISLKSFQTGLAKPPESLMLGLFKEGRLIFKGGFLDYTSHGEGCGCQELICSFENDIRTCVLSMLCAPDYALIAL